MALTKIPNNLIAADAITGTLIADDAINSEHIADGAIDAAHMSVNSIDSDSYVDGSIDTAHIGDDQVTAAKLANAINTSISEKAPLASPTFTGNVGIGGAAADPQGFGRSLHVEGGTNAAIYLRDTGNSNYGYIGFIGGSTNKTSLNSYQGYLQFTTAAGVAAMTIDTSQKVLIGQTSSVTNGKLQVTGGIGLTGNSEIRSSTNSDNGDTIKFFGTQMVAGSNSHTYGYSEGGYIASLATAGNAILLDAGNTTADTGHRFRVKNAGNGVDGSLQYIDGTTVRFRVDSSTGIIKENDIPVRSRAIAMAMVFG
jgi:hypothetical protein